MCRLKQNIVTIKSLFLITLFCSSTELYSQESKQTEKNDPPALKIPRAEENYSYLNVIIMQVGQWENQTKLYNERGNYYGFQRE